jgi:hypothetical protein
MSRPDLGWQPFSKIGDPGHGCAVEARPTPMSQRRWPMGEAVRGTRASQGHDFEGSGRKGLTENGSPWRRRSGEEEW